MFEDQDEDKKLHYYGAQEFDPNSGGFGWLIFLGIVGCLILTFLGSYAVQ